MHRTAGAGRLRIFTGFRQTDEGFRAGLVAPFQFLLYR